jgi:3-hydroxyacyl-[acyl-carrier-protein] dehydratase
MRSRSTEAHLDNPSPDAYLPHRHPFLHVDRLISLEPGKGATGIRQVTGEPGEFSPFLLIETMAQLAGMAAAGNEGEQGLLAAVNGGEFLLPVATGDTLRIEAEIVKSFAGLHLVTGRVTRGEQLVAFANLTLAVGRD